MPKLKPIYTNEFKQQLVDLYRGGKRKSDIIREYGVSESALRTWIKQAESTGSFKASDNRTSQENELIKLRKENKHLQMENDILKQAALILGRK